MSSHVSDCISSVLSVCRVISVKLITKGSEQTVSEIISERQTLKIISKLLGSYKPRDTQVHCVFPESIHTPPTEGFFGLNPSHPHPSGNSSLGSYIPLKILAFNTPSPSEFSNDPLWWGYGYFLEPHIGDAEEQMRSNFYTQKGSTRLSLVPKKSKGQQCNVKKSF